MAKLKYDRVICVDQKKNSFVSVPKDEVWKITTKSNVGGIDPSTKLYGGVHFRFSGPRSTYIRHRLQTRRRVNNSMEVVLHG